MNELLPLISEVLWRATWLMGGALLLASLLRRRRPLIASSLLTATLLMLLILPVLAIGLPSLRVPLWLAERTHDSGIEAALLPVDSMEGTQLIDRQTARDDSEDAVLRRDGGTAAENSRMENDDLQYEMSALLGNGAERRLPNGRSSRAPRGAASSRSALVLQWPAVVVAVYVLGLAILLVKLSAGLALVHRLRRSAVEVGGDWEVRCALWQNRLGIHRPLKLLASEMVAIPTTFGWRKPVIILPTTIVASSGPHQDAVLLHELAHIHRHDYRDLLLLHFAQALYWCHPLVWAIRLVTGPLREQACDDVCVHWLGDARTYRDALLAVARQTLARPRLALGLAMARTSRLSRRVAQIERSSGSDRCAPAIMVRLAVSCAVFLSALLVAVVQFVPQRATADAADNLGQGKIATAEPNSDTANRQPDPTKTPGSATDLQPLALVSRRPATGERLEKIDPAKLEKWLYVADEPTLRELRDAIGKGQQSLLAAQQPDGAWDTEKAQWRVGMSSLALLALLKTGAAPDSPEIRRGLDWLRTQQPHMTYETSLMIQALAAANEGNSDVKKLATLLEEGQTQVGPSRGSWRYTTVPAGDGDNSNAQFAILGLHEAGQMGVSIGNETLRRARVHWIDSQNADGSWGYSGGAAANGTGSMTAAGIASLHLLRALLRPAQPELNEHGALVCREDPQLQESLDRARRWLGDRFSVQTNPGSGQWLLYYLAGVARAGRYGGHRIFVAGGRNRHDWYREGADFLIHSQNRAAGTWKEGSQDAIVGTSFALLFLSRGLEPVLVSKLQFGKRDANQNSTGHQRSRHPNDISNLMQFLSRRPTCPKQITWQTVDVAKANVADLQQAPIVYVSGSEAPQFTPEDVALLKSYLARGGSLFVDSACRSEVFDKWFRNFVGDLYPPTTAQLKLLPGEHPVYHSDYNIVDEIGNPVLELWGLEIDNRTAIVYSPHGLSCLWDKWTAFDVLERPKSLTSKIELGVRVGTNVVTYLTREALARERGDRN